MAIDHQTIGTEILVVRNFNTDLEFPDVYEYGKAIATAMATEGLEDMVEHFLPHKLPLTKYVRTWSMLHSGQEVRSWMDYILGMERHMFQNVSIWDPRNNTNHYMVLGCLRGMTLREHQRYIGSQTRLPLYPPQAIAP